MLEVANMEYRKCQLYESVMSRTIEKPLVACLARLATLRSPHANVFWSSNKRCYPIVFVESVLVNRDGRVPLDVFCTQQTKLDRGSKRNDEAI